MAIIVGILDVIIVTYDDVNIIVRSFLFRTIQRKYILQNLKVFNF